MPSDEELIAGFLSGKPQAEAEFVEVFQRHARAEVGSNFPSLWPHVRDLVQSACLVVCKLRKYEPEKVRAPMRELVKFAVAAPAMALKRARKMEPLPKRWDQSVPATQEAAFETKRLLEIAGSLPERMGKTILAYLAYQMGDGPPLHAALGVERRVAEKRLARAKRAVRHIAMGEDIEEVLEVEDD
jgi:hypothetical protein